jgi:hypothetical protein
MFLDKSAFISYKLVSNLCVRMGNNSYLLVLGGCLAIISLNGQCILIRNALHVPGLVVLLYSLCAHFTQPGCGFIGASGVGILVYFLAFVLLVNTSKDCHLSCKSLGQSSPLDSLHYIQPPCAPLLYPSKIASHSVSKSPAIIKDDSASDDSDVLTWHYSQPKYVLLKQPPYPVLVLDNHSMSLSSTTLDSVSAQLHSLTEAVSSLLPNSSQDAPTSVPVSPTVQPPSRESCTSSVLASTMTGDEIISIFHKNSALPLVHPCNTANASNTKTHLSAEELHQAMGCHTFRNYKTLLQVSCDGEWVDGGEFPPLLGSFATIPMGKRGLPLSCTPYRYLDGMHMDITFGDCLLVGGYRYALILVDRATRYNWTFGLKSLSYECMLSALCLFRAAAGALACCFYCNCNAKLFGLAISEYLIDNNLMRELMAELCR